LPLQAGVLSIDSTQIHVSAIKQAEDKSGIIVRLFNPSPDRQNIALSFGFDLIKAILCRMDESEIDEIEFENNNVQIKMDAKKIVTLKIILK
jgi:alpha-mannosidase